MFSPRGRLDLSPQWQAKLARREIGEQDDEGERERGGGRWSVKYEEVITLVAAGRTYLEERRLGTMVPRRGLCGLEQRKGGVVTVVAVVREGRKSSSTGWCK